MIGNWELGDLRAVRLADWSEKDGVVVVHCPRPARQTVRELPAWFRWWTGPQRLRLDETGSAAWRLFDGQTTLGQVVKTLEADLDVDSSEAMQDRVDIFVRVLLRERMLELRG